MTTFFVSMILSHSTPVYPKPSNPGVCQSAAACRRQVLLINGVIREPRGAGPRK